MSDRDEELMGQIVDKARSEWADERLERLSKGQLPSDELEGLLSEAASSPELARLIELHMPMSDTAVSELSHRAVRQVQQVRSTRKRRRTVGAAIMAVAASIALVLSWPTSRVDPLPAYALSVQGELRTTRGAVSESGPKRFALGTTLELVLRPETEVDQTLVASASIRREGRDPKPLGVSPTIASSGSVRWRGRTEDLFGEESGPADVTLQVAPRDGSSSGQTVELAVVIQESPIELD
ncbi:MAG: hypothetical protein AAF851_05315 [Myxococcota bacterium]